AIVLAADRELVDHEELVSFRVVPVDRVHVSMLHTALRAFDPDFNSASESVVERHVTTEGVGPGWCGEQCNRILNSGSGQIRILLGQEGPQAITKDDLSRRAIELDARYVAITEAFQPFDGGELKLSFAAPVRQELVGYPESLRLISLQVAWA